LKFSGTASLCSSGAFCRLQPEEEGRMENAVKEGIAQPLWKIVLTVLVLVKHDPEYLLIAGIVGSHLDWKKTNKKDKYCTKLHKKCTVELTLVGKERTMRLGQTWQEE